MRQHLSTTFPLPLLALTLLALLVASPARAQGPLTCGQMALGAINFAGDADTWTISANAGDAIVVRAGEITQTGTFYPHVSVYDPASVLVGSSYGAAAAEVAVTAASSGTYTVIVDDASAGHNGTGTYRLTLAQTGVAVAVSPGDEGGPLTNGAMHTGTIDTGDLDVWTLSANTGDAIVVRMGDTAATALYPHVRVFSPGGTAVGNSYGAGAAEVAVNATSTGTYLVVVDDASSGLASGGGYRLTLAHTGAAVTVSPGDDGGPLTNGAMHTGTIDTGDLDLWTLSANTGDAIVVRMGDTAATALYPHVRVFSPGGTAVGNSYGAGAAEVAVNATSTGTYLVVVDDASSGLASGGGYRLTLAHTGAAVTVSPGDDGGPLTNGAMHTGTIDTGDLDLWTLTANTGDAIVVRMGETAATALYPHVRIFSPGGTAMDNSYGAGAAEVAVNATSTGTYLVVVDDASAGLASSGGYRLTLAKTGAAVTVSPGDDGGPLTNGAMHTGTIDTGDLDVWTLTANTGDAIVVRMGETAATALYPHVRIFSPSGTAMDNSYGAGAAEVAVNATSTGTYLVVVDDASAGLASSGPYRLSLAKTGAAVAVSPGDEGGALPAGVTSAFVSTGDLDAWTLSAVAGAPIVVSMAELAPIGGLYPYLRIYSPAGVLLQSNYGTIHAQVSVTAPVTGTYLVVAGDASSGLASAGGYWITPSNAAGVDDVPQPITLALSAAGPNPFAGHAALRYALPRDGAVALRLYDAQGRLVRTLVNEPNAAAGTHAATWDGRDAGGSRANPGVYLARLEAGGRSLVQKLVMAR